MEVSEWGRLSGVNLFGIAQRQSLLYCATCGQKEEGGSEIFIVKLIVAGISAPAVTPLLKFHEQRTLSNTDTSVMSFL